MASEPLSTIARWRAEEGALESGLPLALVGVGWWQLEGWMSGPAPGRPYTGLELAVILGAGVALTAWAGARQVVITGRRSPMLAAGLGLGLALISLATVRLFVQSSFSSWCTGTAKGVLASLPGFGGGDPVVLCQVGGVAGNPYLPGTLVAPAWSGQLPVGLWAWLLAVGLCSALGTRDLRLVRTGVVARFARQFRLAPAAGLEGAIGGEPEDGHIQACANPTLWGEVCGQIYAAEKVFLPGEWCVRCQQVYRRADRELTFSVVSLFSGDIDVLNGLERLDTLSWPRGEAPPPDARISGQERWVTLGRLRVPDVLTVASTLAIAGEHLSEWGKGNPTVAAAAALAKARASRVCGWIWFGRYTNRLTYARPTPRVLFAVGPTRLRDLVPEGGEELVLQLDIGLLPLELRSAFRKTFLDEAREAEVQNSKVDLWIPVAPPPGTGESGVWVDRVEGEALRAWLATERRRAPGTRGVSVPLPYLAFDEDHPAQNAVPDGQARLDVVRLPFGPDAAEPELRRAPGDSVAEWDWLEWEQIQLLRQQCLVLLDAEGEA